MLTYTGTTCTLRAAPISMAAARAVGGNQWYLLHYMGQRLAILLRVLVKQDIKQQPLSGTVYTRTELVTSDSEVYAYIYIE